MGNFTKQGPCCAILKVRTDDINDIEFDFDKSNVYNVESVTSDNDITHVTTADKEGRKERLHPKGLNLNLSYGIDLSQQVR